MHDENRNTCICSYIYAQKKYTVGYAFNIRIKKKKENTNILFFIKATEYYLYRIS